MIIVDSSSLILLAKLNMLDILIGNIKHKIVIPQLVYAECTAKQDLFDAQIIKQRVTKGLIGTIDISNRKLYNKIVKDFNLGKGEAESITLCIELKSGMITDDKKAINACRVLKIKFTTVPRLVVRFYKKKLLTKTEANLIIKELHRLGRYSDDIMNKVKEDLK